MNTTIVLEKLVCDITSSSGSIDEEKVVANNVATGKVHFEKARCCWRERGCGEQRCGSESTLGVVKRDIDSSSDNILDVVKQDVDPRSESTLGVVARGSRWFEEHNYQRHYIPR